MSSVSSPDTSTEVVVRQRTYSDEDRASVQALMRQGWGASHIAQETDIPLRTVQHWMRHWRDVAQEEGDRELLDGEYRQALYCDALILDALDNIAAAGNPEKYLAQLNFLSGTPRDKINARKQGAVQQHLTDTVAAILYQSMRARPMQITDVTEVQE